MTRSSCHGWETIKALVTAKATGLRPPQVATQEPSEQQRSRMRLGADGFPLFFGCRFFA